MDRNCSRNVSMDFINTLALNPAIHYIYSGFGIGGRPGAGGFGWSLQQFFILLALLNLSVGIYICRATPAFLLRLAIRALTRTEKSIFFVPASKGSSDATPYPWLPRLCAGCGSAVRRRRLYATGRDDSGRASNWQRGRPGSTPARDGLVLAAQRVEPAQFSGMIPMIIEMRPRGHWSDFPLMRAATADIIPSCAFPKTRALSSLRL
jgi:hypothetical protein